MYIFAERNDRNMRVLSGSGFGVYIYDDEHPPPHCHIIFNDDEELVITLPLLMEMFGKPIPKKVSRYLTEHLLELIDVWETKHPETKRKTKKL